MNEKEQLIKQIEKMKMAVRDIDDHINMINELLRHYDNVSIDELPMEFQNSVIEIMKTRNELIRHKLAGQQLIAKSELLLSIGE